MGSDPTSRIKLSLSHYGRLPSNNTIILRSKHKSVKTLNNRIGVAISSLFGRVKKQLFDTNETTFSHKESYHRTGQRLSMRRVKIERERTYQEALRIRSLINQ